MLQMPCFYPYPQQFNQIVFYSLGKSVSHNEHGIPSQSTELPLVEDQYTDPDPDPDWGPLQEPDSKIDPDCSFQ